MQRRLSGSLSKRDMAASGYSPAPRSIGSGDSGKDGRRRRDGAGQAAASGAHHDPHAPTVNDLTKHQIIAAAEADDANTLRLVPVSDELRERIWNRFVAVAKRGFCTGPELWSIVEDFNAAEGPFDVEDVAKLQRVGYAAAVAIVAFAAPFSRTAHGVMDLDDDLDFADAAAGGGGAAAARQHHPDHATGGLSSVDEDKEGDGLEVALPLGAYLKAKMGMLHVRPGLQVTLRPMLDDLRPRTLLLAASATLIILIGAVVAVTGSTLWLARATEVEMDGVRTKAALVRFLGEELEQRFVSQSAAGMADASLTAALVNSQQLPFELRKYAVFQRTQTASAAAVVAFNRFEHQRRDARTAAVVTGRFIDSLEASLMIANGSDAMSPCPLPTAATAAVLSRVMSRGTADGIVGREASQSQCPPRTTATCADAAAPEWPSSAIRQRVARAQCLWGLGSCAFYAGCVASPLIAHYFPGPASAVNDFLPAVTEAHDTILAAAVVNVTIAAAYSEIGRAFDLRRQANASSTSWVRVPPSLQTKTTLAVTNVSLDALDEVCFTATQTAFVAAFGNVSSERNIRSTIACDVNNAPIVANSGTLGAPTVEVQANKARSAVALLSSTAFGDGERLMALSASSPEASWIERRRRHVVRTANYLNWAFVRTTEIVVGGMTTDEGGHTTFEPQMNSFRFVPSCYERCERFPPSTRNMVYVLKHHTASGWSITPDYRPWPVVGAYAYLDQVDLGFVMERDVRELRGSALKALTGILDTVQANTLDTSIIEAFELHGTPPMPYFGPQDPCQPDTDCRSSPHVGLYFQYACQHCERLQETAGFREDRIDVLTDVTRLRCAVNCSADDDPGVGAVTEALHAMRRGEPSEVTVGSRPTQPWRRSSGMPADTETTEDDIGQFAYVANLSLGLHVGIARSELTRPLTVGLAASLGGALLLVVVGVLVVLALSNEALRSLDQRWVAHQKDLRESRDKFATLVREVMAPELVTRLLHGETTIAERARVALVAVDVCGFGRYSTSHAPPKVARLILYYREVVRQLAGACDLYRLHCYGDVAVYFAMRHLPQRGDGGSTANSGAGGPTPDADDTEQLLEEGVVDSNHQVCRAMRFAVAVLHAFSDETAHYPSQYAPLAELFSDVDRAAKRRYSGIPAVRAGCHWGAAVLGVFDKTNAVPQLDLIGPAASATVRLCSTLHPHEIAVTSSFKDALTRSDPSRAYTFSEPHRMMMKAVGNLMTYKLTSWKQRELPDALGALGAAPAPQDFPFDPATQQKKSLFTVPIDQFRIGGHTAASRPAAARR
jgi:hypothetical protein